MTTANGAPIGQPTVSGAPVGSSGGSRFPMEFGGQLDVAGAAGVGKRMRSGGISNSGTFTGADAGSEWEVPQDGTIDQVTFARTNTTGNTTMSIDINGAASGTTFTITTGNLTANFTGLGLAVTGGQRVSLRFDSGSTPDFTSSQVIIDL